MKARIITEPNIVEFNGEKYDLQLDFYTLKECGKKYGEGIDQILSRFDNLDVIFDVLATLMNSNIIQRNFERREDEPLLNGDYLAAKIPKEDLPMFTRAIAQAFGLKVQDEVEEEDELDKIMDEAGLENPKNLEAES